MASYIFGGDTGKTPEDVRQQRELADMLLGRTSAPQNVGQGFNAIMSGLVSRMNRNAANEAEQQGRSSANSEYADRIRSMITGQPQSASGATAGAQPMTSTPDIASAPASGGGGMDAYRNAIASIESAGSGDYGAVGPTHSKLGRALGRYQIMEANVGPWSKQVLGREVSPDEFMANPEIQDAIFDGVFGGYVDEYGPEGAAQAWFAGPGGVGKGNRQDSLGTSVSAYTDKFRDALGGAGQPTRVASLGNDPRIQNLPSVMDDSVSTEDATQTMPNVSTGAVNSVPRTQTMPNVLPGGGQQRGAPQTSPQPAQQPRQTAQAPQAPSQGQRPQQTAQGPSLEELLMTAQNPWLNDNQRSVINSMIEQEMQRQDPAYQQQMEMNDLQLEQMRRDLNAPNLQSVGGQLYNPDTGEWIAPPAAPEQADPFTLSPGQTRYGPNGEVIAQGAQEPAEFETVTLQMPDGGQRSFNTSDPAQAQQANALLGQGAVEVKGSMVDINMPGEDAGANQFWGTLGNAATQRYVGMMESGNKAARTLSQLDQLEGLLANSPQGFEAAATQFAGNFGLDIGNATGVQAAQALISQMVPAQRPPGSGEMSDADLNLFKQSVPRLINQPGGNELIIQTMRDINNYDMQLAGIVEDYSYRGQGAQTPEEARALREQMRSEIGALQNPLENFSDRISGYRREDAPSGGQSQRPSQSQANPSIMVPEAGTVEDGYRFLGGDPADQNSWERVQ